MKNLIYEEETYLLRGICMQIHNEVWVVASQKLFIKTPLVTRTGRRIEH